MRGGLRLFFLGKIPVLSVTTSLPKVLSLKGGKDPPYRQIRKVVFDPFPWTKNKCFLGKIHNF